MHRWSFQLLFFLLCCALGSGTAFAQDVWTITRGDFTESRSAVQSISPSGIMIDTAGGEAFALGWEDVLEIKRTSQRPAIPDGAWVVLLHDGARLIGAAVGLREEALAWTTAAGEFTLPLASIRAIARGSEVEAALLESPAQDTVTLANGDCISGIVDSIGPDGVTFAGSPEVGWETILAVKFAGLQGSERSTESGFLVRLSGGGVLTGDSLQQADGRLLVHRKGSPIANVAAAAVVAIEHRNGPVRWLTDRVPEAIETRPYFGESAAGVWFGDGLTATAAAAADRAARTAIVASSYSRIDYAIDPDARAFRTSFLIDGQLPYANCIVRFKLDDTTSYEMAGVSAATPMQTVTIPVNTAKKLTIEVDYGKTFDVQDRVLFIDPAFLNRLPVPTTRPG